MLSLLPRVVLSSGTVQAGSGLPTLAYRSAGTAAVATSTATNHASDNKWWFGVIAAMSGATGVSIATAYADSPPSKAASVKATRESPLLLYQYEVCPWCNKVKAVLDFYNTPYRTVEVNPVFKSQLKFSEYKKVPVLVTPDGEQLNGSGTIIEQIQAEHSPAKSGWFGTKSAPVESAEVTQWRNWADATLVNLVTLNIYRSFGESFQVMEYARHEESFSTVQQTVSYSVGGLMMYVVGRRLPAKYGYTGADVREELRSEVNSFIAAVGKRDFLGGKSPSLADLQVFGILRAINSTDTFQFVINETEILPWWTRMLTQVGEAARVDDRPELE